MNDPLRTYFCRAFCPPSLLAAIDSVNVRAHARAQRLSMEWADEILRKVRRMVDPTDR